MPEFDILDKEMEVGFMELNNMIYLQESADEIDMFMESGKDKKDKSNSPSTSSDSFFDRILKKINEIFTKIKERLTEIFQGNKVKEGEKRLNEAIKEDPKLKNKKVKVKDRKKELDIASQVTKGIIDAQTIPKLEAEMKKYRKQRNLAIAGGAVATISVGALAVFLSKGLREQVGKLEEIQEKQKSHINHLKVKCKNLDSDKTKAEEEKQSAINRSQQLYSKNKALTAENAELKKKASVPRKIKASVKRAQTEVQSNRSKMQADLELSRSKAQSFAEVSQDLAGTVVNGTKELVEIALDKNTSKLGKVMDGVKSVTDTINKTKDSVEEGKEKTKRSGVVNLDKMFDDYKDLHEKRKRAKEIKSDPKRNKETVEKATKFLKDSHKRYVSWHDQLVAAGKLKG